MPEAAFLCLDTSDYMRNGDYFPNRMMAVQEAATLVVSARLQSNPENTLGFLTMAGKACSVRESLTSDSDRVLAALTHLLPGGPLHFSHSLQIAQLALSHSRLSHAEKRAIIFIGSPISESPTVLEKLARKLKRDNVSVDVVAFGVPANVDLLKTFVQQVDKNSTSHFIDVPREASIVDRVLSSVLISGSFGDGSAAAAGGDGAGPGMAAAGGMGAGAAGGMDFSGMDPDMAMAIRMSLEEDQERQRRAAAAAGAAPGPSADAPPPTAAAAAPRRPLTEDEELQQAILLSMAESEAAAAAAQAQAAPAGPAPPPAGAPCTISQSTVAEAFANPDFMSDLARDLGVDPGAATGAAAPPAGAVAPPPGTGAVPPAPPADEKK